MSSINTKADFALVFPGQGSQSVGMMTALAEQFNEVRRRFDSASNVLGFDLWDLVASGPESALNRTENTQPAMLAASVATWDIWMNTTGIRPQYMAGHSFGEYTALVCAGALAFETAVALVADRGRYMQDAVPAGHGAMAAVLGLDIVALEAVCAEASMAGGECSCANLNAPGQIVIAGHSGTIDRACELAIKAGAKRAIRLPISVPVHCQLMHPAALRLKERLLVIELAIPHTDVIHNADVTVHRDSDAIRDALVRQLYSPVRWIETIEYFAAQGVSTIAECGPGKILTALIKRIDRSLNTVSLSTKENFTELDAILTEGR
jgi:[acyl-carrier-protein] S-malonyltransferase